MDSIIESQRSVRNEVDALLDKFGIDRRPSGLYYKIGEEGYLSKWILHLSVVLSQYEELVTEIVPVLVEEKVYFKIARSVDIADDLLSGRKGLERLGKLICIYPKTNKQLCAISGKLILRTAGFRGPAVLTDGLVDNILYARCHQLRQGPKQEERDTTEKPDGEPLDLKRYMIPFELPDGIPWPFESALKLVENNGNFLNDRHKITAVMRVDVKGNMYKGLYWQKGLSVKHCVIKEGKENMWSDREGRSIRERLLWQQAIANEIGDSVSIPRIYEYFEAKGCSYLSMEYIDGETLELWVYRILGNRRWSDLVVEDRARIIDCVTRIFNMVEEVHRRQIVIRDIHPGNFLIDKQNILYLIDFELAYDLRKNLPSPPFKLGTPSFMSPEQQRVARPTVAEDLYAIGSTLIMIFTGLLPGKFEIGKPEVLRAQLRAFIPAPNLVNAISVCLSPTPERRPSLAVLMETFQECRTGLLLNNSMHEPPLENSSVSNRKDLVVAVNGLTEPPVFNLDRSWLSNAIRDPRFNHHMVNEKALYPGIAVGAAGPCYVLSRAIKANAGDPEKHFLLINSLQKLTKNSWENDSRAGSYFFGLPGLAVATGEAIKCGLIDTDPTLVDFMEKCLLMELPAERGLAVGLAGRGIVALQLASILPEALTDHLVDDIASKLIQKQQADRSGELRATSASGAPVDRSFSSGSSGIIYFLLCCLEKKRVPAWETAVTVGLGELLNAAPNRRQWLISLLRRKKEVYQISLFSGILGPAITLMKAFIFFKDEKYLSGVERILDAASVARIGNDVSLGAGLIGLGEVLVEARDSLRLSKYDTHLAGLARFIMDHYRVNDLGGRYWNIGVDLNHSGDLLTGNAGVIHFLLRYNYPKAFSFPMLLS